uniref:Cysteine-rich secretory protein LCCL domain containing 1b n=1 Tax=Salmo trutta TaxID=8032 RepID=A0A673X6R9_SALTR
MQGALDWLRGFGLLFFVQTVLSMVIPNSTHLEMLLEKYMNKDDEWWVSKQRGKRAITEGDMHLILDLHNNLRGQVYPQASNMEYMVWDTDLERSAEHWAHTCRWEHGPQHMLTQIGQNLGAHWGRDRPPTFHVQAWYDEVRDYSYPYPQECNPHCPFRCSGPVCTHYTQMVWATSSHIGCAINVCYNMNVWGMIWTKAVYLVCNYSPPGNWWGHAPYQHGSPCSACPPSYGGGCRDNLCYTGRLLSEESCAITNWLLLCILFCRDKSLYLVSLPEGLSEIVFLIFKGQQMDCETKLRDRCKETTCNRYECPPGCLSSPGKVIGTAYYDMQSSVCGAGLHAGIIDNDGGWLDVTRHGRKPHFTKSYKNGIHNACIFQMTLWHLCFSVKAVPCETTVARFCPYKRPARHCPRLYCPRNCLHETRARVIGTQYYSDKSSICRAAIHAGVIQNDSGGYLDVQPVDKRRQYSGSYQNGISSESLQNPSGGKAFRVFAVI